MPRQRIRLRLLSLGIVVAALVVPGSGSIAAREARDEPVSFVAHGAMFDATGTQLVPTLPLVRDIQGWYRQTLLSRVSEEDRKTFAQLESRLAPLQQASLQDRLIVNARLLDWLADRAKLDRSYRVLGKLNALNASLRYVLADSGANEFSAWRRPYQLGEDTVTRLRAYASVLARPSKANTFVVTTAGGAEYRQLCAEHGVPLPPDFGPGSPWVSRGVIERNDLFIVREFRAEVLTYQSANPAGLCIALPRFDDQDMVQADGIICLGQNDPLNPKRAKTCFWDNQDPKAPAEKATFTFRRGDAQSTSVFAGGSDLRAGVGGVCSDCHSGENPYVVHGTLLSDVADVLSGVMFASTWYEPIVRTGDTDPWPENPGPAVSAPKACRSCHEQGDAGRLPAIAPAIDQYCRAVLRSSLGARIPPTSPPPDGQPPLNPPASMPPSKPGSQACTPNVPSGDPRRVECTSAHTMTCTPTFKPLANGSPDPRSGDPLFQLKCTPEIGSLLAMCEKSVDALSPLSTKMHGKVQK